MNKNPLVSIIIPVYNGSDYLKESIDSALGQDYPRVEIIVINDGSTDNGKTERIAISYGSRIKYIKKDNGGVSTALNLGIEAMSGDFFSWLSHDDTYLPNKITEQLSLYQSSGDSNFKKIIFSNFDFIDDKGGFIRRGLTKDPENLLSEIFLRRYPIYGCSLLIPKICFTKAGAFDTKLRCTQDYDLWLRFIKKGFKFLYCPKVLCRYRQHSLQGTNLSSELFTRCQKEEIQLYKHYLNVFGIRKISEGKPNLCFKVLYKTHLQHITYAIRKKLGLLPKKANSH